MKVCQLITLTSLVIISFSCNTKNQQSERKEFNSADTALINAVSSSAAKETGNDTTRKFIRTADLKFKVNNVIAATYDIEAKTSEQGGFVTYTNLASNMDENAVTPLTADSSLETSRYTVINSMIIRVPNVKLDTLLKAISQNIDYLDYRVIKADDVSLKLLSNNLAQVRSGKSYNRIASAVAKTGKKLNENLAAENVLDSKNLLTDNAILSNLDLNDQVKYSTVNLSLYQAQTIKHLVVLNPDNVEKFTPGFGSKLSAALSFGWNLLEIIILSLTRLWGLLFIIILVYLAFKIIRRNMKTY